MIDPIIGACPHGINLGGICPECETVARCDICLRPGPRWSVNGRMACDGCASPDGTRVPLHVEPRCPDCDRARPTAAQRATTAPGEGVEFCWSRDRCGEPIDWRARARAAEKRATAEATLAADLAALLMRVPLTEAEKQDMAAALAKRGLATKEST